SGSTGNGRSWVSATPVRASSRTSSTACSTVSSAAAAPGRADPGSGSPWPASSRGSTAATSRSRAPRERAPRSTCASRSRPPHRGSPRTSRTLHTLPLGWARRKERNHEGSLDRSGSDDRAAPGAHGRVHLRLGRDRGPWQAMDAMHDSAFMQQIRAQMGPEWAAQCDALHEQLQERSGQGPDGMMGGYGPGDGTGYGPGSGPRDGTGYGPGPGMMGPGGMMGS